MNKVQARSFDEVEQHIESFRARLDQIEDMTFKHNRMFVVLQTPLWKRVLFRLDGWQGQSNLDSKEPHWRPWRRFYTS